MEAIDEGLVRDLAERVRCQRLRSYLQRTAGRRRQSDSKPGFTGNVDERIYAPRPALAQESGL